MNGTVEVSAEQEIKLAAMQWAMECGLTSPFKTTDPTKKDYGWEVTVIDFKNRTADVRFNKEGQRQMWEITSR